LAKPDRLLDFENAGSSSVAHRVVNSGIINLDPDSGGGGSSLSLGGALVNGGVLTIGTGEYGTLSAASTVNAASVTNIIGEALGTIELFGSSSAEARATLDVGSAAGFGTAGTLEGYASLSDDALIEFSRGQITTIAASSTLTLAGPDAFVADASNTSSNSALKGLKTVDGTLSLSGGATLTTSGDLTDTGQIDLEGDDTLLTVGGDLDLTAEHLIGATQGATLSVKGALTNDDNVSFENGSDGEFAGSIDGTGFINVFESKVQFGSSVSSGQTISLDGAPNEVTLDSPSSFQGTIDYFFTVGDVVDATTFAKSDTTFLYTQTSSNTCTWTLTDGADTAVLHFAGETYAKSDFSIVSANGGAGSAIKFV
jgi:hypothetical protein